MSIQLKLTHTALPRTERGRSFILGSDPNNVNVLYTNGNSVIIRNLKDATKNDVYTQHSTTVSVAKYSPSGFYIASADMNGKIRIWDTVNAEHILKNEFQPFAGPVKDLSWSGDNQRICVVGEGRERFGAVINAETGTTVGEIMGMSRPANSVDFRSERPFRLVIGSEDSSICFFEGPPFKLKQSSYPHDNFVNVVRYTRSGAHFISGGSDGKLCVFEGKTGVKLHEVVAHKGGIYSLSISSDSEFVVSVSGDKSIKKWHITTGGLLEEGESFQFENLLDNMLLSVLWQEKEIICGTLSGLLHVFNCESLQEGPLYVIAGHNKPITVSSRCAALGDNAMITGSSDGKVCVWTDVLDGSAKNFMLNVELCHSNMIQSCVIRNDRWISVGIDDHLLFVDLSYQKLLKKVKFSSQPRSLSVLQHDEVGTVVIACISEIVIANESDGIICSEKVDYEPEAIAITGGDEGSIVIVGSRNNSDVYIYSYNNGLLSTLTTEKDILKGGSTSIKVSPDGQYLAIADLDKNIFVYTIERDTGKFLSIKRAHNESWRFHVARINCLAWSPNSRYIASGSIDCNIFVWDVQNPSRRVHKQGAHPMNQITSLEWLSDDTLVSTGQDSNMKIWTISEY